MSHSFGNELHRRGIADLNCSSAHRRVLRRNISKWVWVVLCCSLEGSYSQITPLPDRLEAITKSKWINEIDLCGFCWKILKNIFFYFFTFDSLSRFFSFSPPKYSNSSSESSSLDAYPPSLRHHQGFLGLFSCFIAAALFLLIFSSRLIGSFWICIWSMSAYLRLQLSIG